MGENHQMQCLVTLKEVQSHYTNIFKREVSRVNANVGNTCIKFHNYKLLASLISLEEVLTTIRNSPANASPGPDCITLTDLKKYDPHGCILASIYNFCMSALYMPNSWRCQLGSRSRDIDNWRTITVYSTIVRTLHKLLLKRITNSFAYRARQAASSTSGCTKNIHLSAFDTLDHDALFVALSNAGCPNFLLDYIRCSYDMCDTRALSIRAHSSKCKHTGENVVRDSTQARVLRSNQTESVIYDLCNDLEPNISFNVQNETTLCLPDHLICNQQSMICSPSSNTDEQCVSSDNTSQPVKTSSSRSPDPEQVQVASNELCRLLSNKDIDSPDLHECGDLLNNVSDALNAGCTRLSLTTLCFNQQHLSSAQPDKIYDINRNRLGQYNIAAIAKHLYMDGRRAHKSKSLLETLGLHAVQIQSSANDIKRSIFNSIYKNPTRTKEVRRKMIGEIKSDKAKWSQFLSINDETTIDYCRLLSDLKQKRSIHGLSLLQIAAEAYQSIFERTNSIKKAIRAVFDGNLSCKDNYVWSLSEIWRQASTQALGIDLMTSKHGPPSSMFSYSYSSKPHHIFVNLLRNKLKLVQHVADLKQNRYKQITGAVANIHCMPPDRVSVLAFVCGRVAQLQKISLVMIQILACQSTLQSTYKSQR
ncbi:hypothetical protein GJ496_006319 [Pomphorhynchus laevis]|nr:hypothetical protein GJ496_006319 [Pomphorhynchus laevis]